MAAKTTAVCPWGLSHSDWGSKDISTKKRRPKDSKSGCSRASEERSFHRKRRTEMPDGGEDDSGMPLGAVAKRLGVRGISTKKDARMDVFILWR